MDTGRANRGGIRIDLLLATTEAAAVPIVVEVRIGTDRDPLYALVQGLAGIAHLATVNQYERIRDEVRGGAIFVPLAQPRFDLYVVAHQPPRLNDNRRLLRDAAYVLA